MPNFEISLVSESLTCFDSLTKDVGQAFFKDDIKYLEDNLEAFNPLAINLSELRKYVQIDFNIETFHEYKRTNYVTEFRHCNADDFERNGLKVPKDLRLRFCPDFEKVKNEAKLRN